MREGVRRFLALGLAAALGVAAFPASSLAEAFAGEQDEETVAEEVVEDAIAGEDEVVAGAEAETDAVIDEVGGVQTYTTVTDEENPVELYLNGLSGSYGTYNIAEASATIVTQLVARSGMEEADVTWSSSDESLLTIDADGTIHGQGKSGTVLITATDAYGNSITQPLRLLTAEDMATQQVEDMFSLYGYGDEIVMSGEDSTLTVYGNLGSSALGFDLEGMIESIKVTSSDESVVAATVKSYYPIYGTLIMTAVSPGEADVTVTVTATTEDGDTATASRTIHMIVEDDVEQAFYISAVIHGDYSGIPAELPVDSEVRCDDQGSFSASVDGVTWTSSDESLLTIDAETGEFRTAGATGSVTVRGTDAAGNVVEKTLDVITADEWVDSMTLSVGLWGESGGSTFVTTQNTANDYSVVLEGDAAALALNTYNTALNVASLGIGGASGVSVSSVYSTDEGVVRWIVGGGDEVMSLQLQFVGHGTAEAWVTFEYESGGETHYATKVVHVTVPDDFPVEDAELEEPAFAIEGLGSAEGGVTVVADDVEAQLYVVDGSQASAASLLSANDDEADAEGYTWESSDPTLMTVTGDGWVQGLGRAGRVVVTATDADGNSASRAFLLVHYDDETEGDDDVTGGDVTTDEGETTAPDGDTGSDGTTNSGDTTDDGAATNPGDDAMTDGGTTTDDDTISAGDDTTGDDAMTDDGASGNGGAATAGDATTSGSTSDEVPATGDFSGLLPAALALLGASGAGLGVLTGRRRRQ